MNAQRDGEHSLRHYFLRSQEAGEIVCAFPYRLFHIPGDGNPLFPPPVLDIQDLLLFIENRFETRHKLRSKENGENVVTVLPILWLLVHFPGV